MAHPDLALAVVIIPTVIHERDAAIDGRSDNPDAIVRIGLRADMVAAQADGGDLLSGAAKRTLRNGVRGRRGAGRADGSQAADQFATIHVGHVEKLNSGGQSAATTTKVPRQSF